MVARHKRKWLIERGTNTSAIGKADAILKHSRSLSCFYVIIDTIIIGSGGHIGHYTRNVVCIF